MSLSSVWPTSTAIRKLMASLRKVHNQISSAFQGLVCFSRPRLFPERNLKEPTRSKAKKLGAQHVKC